MNEAKDAERHQNIDVNQLIQDLASKDLKTHESAHIELLVSRDEAVPALIQTLDSKDWQLRWEAAKTLAEMRSPALAPIFVKNLENKDPDIRWLSAEGLIALGNEALVPLLEVLSDYSGSLWLKQSAHHVLYDLYWGRLHEGENEYHTKRPLDDEEKALILPILDELEKSESPLLVSAYAKLALKRLGRRDHKPDTNIS
jgi:hypothetical protein